MIGQQGTYTIVEGVDTEGIQRLVEVRSSLTGKSADLITFWKCDSAPETVFVNEIGRGPVVQHEIQVTSGARRGLPEEPTDSGL